MTSVANVIAAKAAAQAWLALVDQEKYDASWHESAAPFKSAVTMPAWNSALVGVRQPLGKVVTRELESTRFATELPGVPDGKYVVIQFNTAFENKAAAVETVTPMQEPDGTWRVSGYFIK